MELSIWEFCHGCLKLAYSSGQGDDQQKGNFESKMVDGELQGVLKGVGDPKVLGKGY